MAVIIDLALLLCGAVYIVWAKPLERYWQHHPDMAAPWTHPLFGNPPTARRSRIVGTIWIVLGVLLGYYLIKLSTAPL
jgi:hypothetical protein